MRCLQMKIVDSLNKTKLYLISLAFLGIQQRDKRAGEEFERGKELGGRGMGGGKGYGYGYG